MRKITQLKAYGLDDTTFNGMRKQLLVGHQGIFAQPEDVLLENVRLSVADRPRIEILQEGGDTADDIIRTISSLEIVKEFEHAYGMKIEYWSGALPPADVAMLILEQDFRDQHFSVLVPLQTAA